MSDGTLMTGNEEGFLISLCRVERDQVRLGASGEVRSWSAACRVSRWGARGSALLGLVEVEGSMTWRRLRAEFVMYDGIGD